ncbi:hypothetical protein RIB2604_02111860 [Aspergillus luchuensis]|uniref:Uncharacterized protein n=1 Tax=Aspergillus kawachii TaxID=1069201 RepID=A0A146FQN5_ASPKA|nr:hypothetical protein RIB2604_02111860 [Aspergillus luchuensis]
MLSSPWKPHGPILRISRAIIHRKFDSRITFLEFNKWYDSNLHCLATSELRRHSNSMGWLVAGSSGIHFIVPKVWRSD